MQFESLGFYSFKNYKNEIKFLLNKICCFVFVLFLIIFLNDSNALAANGYTTYQARIYKSDNTPLESANVSFVFTVKNPSSTCSLYTELYTAVNMQNSGGLISISLGSGTKTFPTSGTLTYQDVYKNTGTFSCSEGGTYTPTTADVRKIVMQFNDGITSTWQTLPPMQVNSVPYAFSTSLADTATSATTASNALALNGLSSSSFVQVPGTCNSGEVLTYNGASFACSVVSGGSGSVTITSTNSYLTVAGTASAPTLTVNVGTTTNTVAAGDDSRITGALQKANNLSDLTSSSTARTNLGLGTAATQNVGTSANNVVQLTAASKLPAVDGSLLTNLSRSQLASGTANYVLINDASGNMSSEAQLAVSRGGTGASSFTGNSLVMTNSGGTAFTSLTCTTSQIPQYNGSSWACVSMSSATSGTGYVTSATAFIQSGNAFGASATLGTTDAQALQFITNNTARVTVTSAGAVGIGTTTPNVNSALDVYGNVRSLANYSMYYPNDIAPLGNVTVTVGSLTLGGPHKRGYSSSWRNISGAGNLVLDFGVAIGVSAISLGADPTDTVWTPQNYTIDVSADCSSYTTIATENSIPRKLIYNFATTSVRCVRINVITTGTSGGNFSLLRVFRNLQADIGSGEPWVNDGLNALLATTGSVGIGGIDVDSSAILDVSSTTKGVLIPRLTSAQRAAIATPATGLQIYNTTSGTIDYYNGSAWTSLSTGSVTSSSIITALGYTPVAATSSSVISALGYTPVASSSASVIQALGYTPAASGSVSVTSASVISALGYTPAASGSFVTSATAFVQGGNNFGTSATVGLVRNMASDSDGQALTVAAAGASVGGSNRNGGDLILKSGVSTGYGWSQIQFQVPNYAAASTADNNFLTMMNISGSGVGLGTDTPLYDLHVLYDRSNMTTIGIENNGSSAAAGTALVLKSSNGTAGVYNYSGGYADTTRAYSTEIVNNSTVGNLLLSTSGTVRMKIQPSGTVVLKGATVNSTSTIDFSAGNLQYTASSCGSFQFNNMSDGAQYTFIVKGSTSATCSFTMYSDAGSTALTVHMPPNHGATIANTHTMYSFIVAGTDVYVAWVPGY